MNRKWLNVFAVFLLCGSLISCQRNQQTPALKSPALLGSAEANLSKSADGQIILSWLQREVRGVSLMFSILEDQHWTAARRVAEGDDWFVNWADFPSVVALEGDVWAAHWLKKRAGGTYAYDVAISLSNDAGESWSAALTPHNDNTPTEHGFVSLFKAGNDVGAIWLDGRNMANTHGDHDQHHGGHMTLRGGTIGADASVKSSSVIDDMVCDCCQTDTATLAEKTLAVYRNKTVDEYRDIFISVYKDGAWQPGRSVADDSWVIDACPVNGPAIDAAGDDVVVAWFTGAQNINRIRIAQSADQGATFASAITIDEANPIGRVDVAMIGEGRSVISWLGRDSEKRSALFAQLIEHDGRIGKRIRIADMAAARRSGFPQMTAHQNSLIFAFTEINGDESRVLTQRLSIADFEQ